MIGRYAMNDRIKILMATEGTYPFHHGGVSTWCDILLNNLNDEMDFIVYSVIMNPFVTQKFTLPDNAKLIKVPLWGTEEPSEHLNIPFSKVLLAKKRTDDRVIRDKFIPLFIELIKEVVSYDKNPKNFGNTLYQLYNYFEEYEYKKSFKSQITWNTYKSLIRELAKNKDEKLDLPGTYALINSLGWIYRFMNILNTPIPKINVSHSAAAAFCSIPCVIAKLQYDAPFLLTEHGVYLREQYLSLSKRGYSSFLNTFLIRLIHSIVSLSYYHADQVSPVCEYNTRWEKEFGVNDGKIEVIYNGVDTSKFLLKHAVKKDKKSPVIAAVARIDPVKDIISLIKAAGIVKRKYVDAKFIVYGSVSVEGYYEECLKLKEELGLGNSFIFAGHINDVSKAYETSDIIALSSITEAFPYSVVEAMMAGKAVIATDVGGIKEALGDCGILIPPRRPDELAAGIITLIDKPELRYRLGEEAKNRALDLFTLKSVQEIYFKNYVKLAVKADKFYVEYKQKQSQQVTHSTQNVKLYIEKGVALVELGYLEEGIEQLRLAAKEAIDSLVLPYILTKIADAYNRLGEYEKAINELDKIELILNVLEQNKTA